MAKIYGFNNNYDGLDDNEAWLRVYDNGKNLMPIKDKRIQRIYNKMFKKKTKVIRSNKVKNIKTDIVVPGDIVVVEKGDFLPADGKILEENGLDLENEILFNKRDRNLENKYYTVGKLVYQGMKVKEGKAVVEVSKAGVNTFLGNEIKEIDGYNKKRNKFSLKLNKYLIIMLISWVIFWIFGFAFSLLTKNVIGANKFSISMYDGFALLISSIPFGLIILMALKIVEGKNYLRKNRVILKNVPALFDLNKVKAICIDDRFLTRKYEEYIQRFYKAGISIVIISDRDQISVTEFAKESGIFSNDVQSISGSEIDELLGEKLIETICNTTIFYGMKYSQKEKVIKTFEKIGIPILCVGDGIEDLVTIYQSLFGISRNTVKKSIDRELSDALIWGNDFKSIYEMVKSGIVLKKALINYFKFSLYFHVPVIVLLIIALINKIELKGYIWLVSTVVFLIIPLLLFLTREKYNEEQIFKLDEEKK